MGKKVHAEELTTDCDLGSLELSGEYMDTRLFTLAPGHLMANSAHAEQQRDKRSQPPSLEPNVTRETAPGLAGTGQSGVVPWPYSRLSTVSILRHLPPRPVVDYLATVYFNTVHWFVVVVHEGHFLHHYRKIMDLFAQNESSIPDRDEDFTFALLILTIAALGGRYASVHAARRRRCTQAFSQSTTGADGSTSDAATATCRLFAVLRNNSTDNLTCGTLATVQSMLLLGNLYLYHGHSNLAWTHTASMVRVAQALELHKEDSEMRWTSPYYQSMDLAERRQLKWRLFWAVHTSDRFLAMCYGLPPLISDEDCVANIPREDCIYPRTGSSSFLMLDDNRRPATAGPTTLLTYQTHKLKFYVILGHIIQTLYRQTKGGLKGIFSQTSNKLSQSSTDQIVNNVRDLDRTLRRWYSELPKELRISERATCPDKEEERTPDDDDDIIDPVHDDACNDSRDVHERRKRIKNSIYSMQALLLQLAYDHALVLIHRPILTLKNNERQAPPKDMLCWSISTCWSASLRISRIGWHPVFDRNYHAHAVSFVGVHLFAAGVILGAFACSDPLSRLALEAKRGLSRVIQMQRRLKGKVIVSAQSLAILEKLAYDVMRKEAKRMFGEGFSEPDNGYSYPEPPSRQEDHTPPTFQEPLPAAPISNGFGANNDLLDPSSINDMQTKENRLTFDALLPDAPLDLGSSMAEVDKRECFWTA
jgi:hypothetical protein